MIRLDDVLGYDNMKIFQDSELFSFSIDSIILANYTNIRLNDKKIIDFCTGNAIIPLILSRRCDKRVEGIEIQKKVCSLAEKTIDYNNLNDRIKIYNCDVKDFCSEKENYNKYDLVLCNPPYFKNYDNTKKNDLYEKTIARHEILIDLESVCNCAKRLLKDNGVFSIVHRTERLIEIIDDLRKNNIEPKSIKFIHENMDKPSTLVIIQGMKCGKIGLKIEKPLILYNLDGSMTEEYRKLQESVRI